MLLLSAAAILVNQEPRLLSELKVLKTKSKAIRTDEPKKSPCLINAGLQTNIVTIKLQVNTD